MIYIKPQGRHVTNAPVGFLSIIPDEVLHQFLVEVIRFIKVIDIEVHPLLLNSTVESLQVAIRLRVLGVVKEMGKAILLAIVVEVPGEFTSVIRLDSPNGKGSHFKELPNKIITVSRRVRLIGIGEGESGFHVNCGEDITFDPGGKDGDRIHLDKVAGETRYEILPPHFPLLGFCLSAHEPACPAVEGNLVRAR